jgi:MFS family permease
LSIRPPPISSAVSTLGPWPALFRPTTGLTLVALASSLASAVAAVLAISTDRLWLAVPALAAFGFAMSTSGIAIQTLIQLASDRSMRGRVMGLYGLIFRGAPAVGALGAGVASAHFGLRWPVLFGALLVAVVWLWTCFGHRRIATALEQRDAERTT